MNTAGAVDLLDAVPVVCATEAGDYIEDGLLMCGKCRTRKQYRTTLFGRERIFPIACKCRREELARERETEEKHKAAELRKDLQRMAMPEKNMKNWTFANAEDTPIIRAARQYADNFREMKKRGKGLVLYGDCGVGKTYAAACIVNALVNDGVPCLMTSFSRIINTLWSVEDKQVYIDSLNQVDLLVIDDLGAERQSEYVAEQVFSVIDGRCRAGLPFIITTNLTLREMTAPQSNKRIYERVLGKCHPVEVTGENRRRARLKADFNEMNRLLGL